MDIQTQSNNEKQDLNHECPASQRMEKLLQDILEQLAFNNQMQLMAIQQAQKTTTQMICGSKN